MTMFQSQKAKLSIIKRDFFYNYINSNCHNLFQSGYIDYYGEDSSEAFTKKVEELHNKFSQLLKKTYQWFV